MRTVHTHHVRCCRKAQARVFVVPSNDVALIGIIHYLVRAAVCFHVNIPSSFLIYILSRV